MSSIFPSREPVGDPLTCRKHGGVLFPAVAVLHSPGEHGQRGGAAEGEALEDLQPVRDPGNRPWTRGGRQGEVQPPPLLLDPGLL